MGGRVEGKTASFFLKKRGSLFLKQGGFSPTLSRRGGKKRAGKGE